MRSIVLSLWATATLAAQAPDLKSASGYVRAVQAQLRRNVERAAEKMPEESYAFRPSNDVRTFGELLGHIADTEYGFCASVIGEPNPNKADTEKDKKSKADIVAAVKGAFAYCEKAYAGLSDDKVAEVARMGNNERNKIGILMFNNAHTNEHYGNMATYMRIRGIVPPSSER